MPRISLECSALESTALHQLLMNYTFTHRVLRCILDCTVYYVAPCCCIKLLLHWALHCKLYCTALSTTLLLHMGVNIAHYTFNARILYCVQCILHCTTLFTTLLLHRGYYTVYYIAQCALYYTFTTLYTTLDCTSALSNTLLLHIGRTAVRAEKAM